MCQGTSRGIIRGRLDGSFVLFCHARLPDCSSYCHILRFRDVQLTRNRVVDCNIVLEVVIGISTTFRRCEVDCRVVGGVEE